VISNCVVNLSAEKLAVLNGVRRLLKRGGEFFFADVYADPRLVSERPLAISDPELAARTGAIRFFSATYRLFSIPELEDACEDHGQAVIYRGTISEHPQALPFDKHHWIEACNVFPCAAIPSACSLTAAWRRISAPSATSAATTGCFPNAAANCLLK
jgi:arsenite methyltransferase